MCSGDPYSCEMGIPAVLVGHSLGLAGLGAALLQGRLGGHCLQELPGAAGHGLSHRRKLAGRAGSVPADRAERARAHAGLLSRGRLVHRRQGRAHTAAPALPGNGMGGGERRVPAQWGFPGAGRGGGLSLRPALGCGPRRPATTWIPTASWSPAIRPGGTWLSPPGC